MKVLRLIGGLDPTHGGPPVSAVNSCIAAQRAGVDTTLVYGAGRKPDAAVETVRARLQAEGVECTVLPHWRAFGDTARRWGLMDGLVRWLRANRSRFDIVHCHGAWQEAALAIAAGAGRAGQMWQAAVLTPHESLTEFDIALSRNIATRLGKRWLRPFFLKSFEMVVFASAIEARDSVATEEHPANRTIIPHPVFDERGGLPPRGGQQPVPGRLCVGFIGRLHAKKNVDVLVRALSRLPDSVSLAVAGEGPEAAVLRNLSVECGVGQRINWLGFIQGPEKDAFFGRIDVLALPSDYECFGVAAAEAMAAGLPVLVSPRTGVAEVIAAHGGGLTVAPDPDAVADGLRALLNRPETRAYHAARAAKAAADAFSFAAHGAALRRCYEKLARD